MAHSLRLKIQENQLPQEIAVVKKSESEAQERTNTIKAGTYKQICDVSWLTCFLFNTRIRKNKADQGEWNKRAHEGYRFLQTTWTRLQEGRRWVPNKLLSCYYRVTHTMHDVDDRLCLVFTQIDPACPEREFSFTIKVDQEDSYQGQRLPYIVVAWNASPVLIFTVIKFMDAFVCGAVESCEPSVDGIADHLECLNTTNDFSAFVRTMRRAFKAQV